MHIGNKIRMLRKERGWSQGFAASKVGISTAAYSKVETGITDIHLSRLGDIADVFGVTVIELLRASEPTAEQQNRLERIREKLHLLEADIIFLQRQIIDLLEELRRDAPSHE